MIHRQHARSVASNPLQAGTWKATTQVRSSAAAQASKQEAESRRAVDAWQSNSGRGSADTTLAQQRSGSKEKSSESRVRL